MNNFKRGFLDGLPIGLGYLAVSFSFGILAVKSGIGIVQATLISLLNLTSAGQFAGLQIMIAGGGLLEMAVTQFIINLRYSLMSVSISQKVDESMKIPQRMLFGFFHTDEIFAASYGRPGKVGVKYFSGIAILPVVGWTLGTFLGAVCGEILPSIVTGALCVALYGMFIAIVVPPMKHSWKISVVVTIAIILSCCFKFVPGLNMVSAGFAIIICAGVASVIGAIFFPVLEEDTSETTNSNKEVAK